MLLVATYTLLMALGRTIRRRRMARGLTQEELAKRAGIGRPYLTLLERGYRTNPTVPVRKRLARALGVPITKLLE